MLVFGSNDDKTPRFHVLANLLLLTSWSIPRLADLHLPNPSTDKDYFFWLTLAVLSLYLLYTASRVYHPIEDTQSRCSHRLALPSLMSLVLIKVCGQISDEHYNLRLASGYLSFFGFPILSIFVYKLPPDPAEPEPMERFPMLSGMYSRILLSSVELENMFEPEIRARQTSETVYFFVCLIATLTCLVYIAATYIHPTNDRLTHYFTASVVAPAVGWFVVLCCRFLPDLPIETRYRFASRTLYIFVPLVMCHVYARQRSYKASIQDHIKTPAMS